MSPTSPGLARSSQVSVPHAARVLRLQTAAATLVFNWCSPVERSASGVGVKSQGERTAHRVGPHLLPPRNESTAPRPQHGGSPHRLAPTPGLDSGLASERWRLLPGGGTDAQEQPWSRNLKHRRGRHCAVGRLATPRPRGLWALRVPLLGSVISHSHRVDGTWEARQTVNFPSLV